MYEEAPLEVAANMKAALRCLSRPVAVISALHQGRRFAMAATAVSELSLAPPAMLVCINHSASLHVGLSDRAAFCINFLSGSQAEIAKACGGGVQGEERFAHGSWSDGILGVPVLADALANFICVNEGRTDYGSHSVFIGRVAKVARGAEVDPLLYICGGYSRPGMPSSKSC